MNSPTERQIVDARTPHLRSGSQTSKIYVVDDDQSVLTGLSRLLRSAGMTAVTFASPEHFLERVDANATGCLVLDVSMPGLTGPELQEELELRGIYLPIIFLTGRSDIPTSVRAMKRGAVDFLTKPVDDVNLIRAILAAIEKDGVERRKREELRVILSRLSLLTKREREVFEHVVMGMPNKQIASELGTVEKTIKVHRSRVMEKLQAESLADMVRLAERAGIGRPQ